MKNEKGFTLVEAVLVLTIILVTGVVSVLVWAQLSAKPKLANDKQRTASLEKIKQELGRYVSAEKTIPDTLETENGIIYNRRDNQTAELCVTFQLHRDGSGDNTITLIDHYRSLLSAKDSDHQIYRDNVDFAKHTSGRNCYIINYAPINEAYDEKYKDTKNSWNVCDAYRGYTSRFNGQTIKGFFIGGSFTTNPGTAGGRAVLAQDADAYDATCKKIPVSELKVGDQIEMYVENGPKNGNEMTYFVKAIKKEY